MVVPQLTSSAVRMAKKKKRTKGRKLSPQFIFKREFSQLTPVLVSFCTGSIQANSFVVLPALSEVPGDVDIFGS